MLTALPARPEPQLPADAPLLACTQFATSDPDEAVEEATKILAPHNMEVRGDLARFRARASHAQLRDASLIYMDYESPLSFHCAPQDMYVAVVLPVSGQMAVAYEGEDVVEVPRGALAVVPAGCRVELRYRTPFSVLSVNAKTSALRAALRRLAPEVDTDDLRFDGIVPMDGRVRGTFYGLMNLLVGIVDQYSSPMLIPPNIVDALGDQAVSAFVLGLPHSRSERMLRSASPISSRMVKQAVEMIVADDYAEKSVADIATGLSVSMRSLELGFRKDLGCTPHAYIQKFRLQKAHDELWRARPGDGTTVTDVAIRWGFNHTGRFAALYRRTYGVPPSEALRKN